MTFVRVSDNVRMRQEHFGGILFNRESGIMLEIDREAFRLVSLIRDMGVVDTRELSKLYPVFKGTRAHPHSIPAFIAQLMEWGILVPMPPGILSHSRETYALTARQQLVWPVSPGLSAPETVHWAVTYRCAAGCPDCYVTRHSQRSATELDTTQALGLIRQVADAGVFQLAIGGGEPFMREDLAELTAAARERGLVVHVTTGRVVPDAERLRAVAPHIRSLQLGVQHELLENNDQAQVWLTRFVRTAGELGLDTGANIILSRSVLARFERLVAMLVGAGFRQITLLRYKPPANKRRWMAEKPDGEDLRAFEPLLARIRRAHPAITFRFDCGLAFLERHRPAHLALRAGLRGCVAAARILFVAPDGTMYPCSQLVGEGFAAGRLPGDDLRTIWACSPVLRRYRFFRVQKEFNRGACGCCIAKMHCGGCRVFAADAIGSDPGCPEPLPRGKKRRVTAERDVIVDIQEAIGCTEAGFPYATREEIQQWLDESTARDYPAWIERQTNTDRRRYS